LADTDILCIKSRSLNTIEIGKGYVVVHHGPELHDLSVGQVPLVLKNEIIGAQPDSKFFLFGLQFFLSQLPCGSVGLDPLVIGLDGPDSGFNLKKNLLLLVFEP
jgi:hypothetical protein